MKIEDLKKQLDENIKKIMDNLTKISDNEKNIQKNSFALELLKYSNNGKNKLYAIIVLILFFWAFTIGLFVYYISTTGYVDNYDYKSAESDEGNACVGDNCNNGEINYGKGSSN